VSEWDDMDSNFLVVVSIAFRWDGWMLEKDGHESRRYLS
jgi:hypothetical protein